MSSDDLVRNVMRRLTELERVMGNTVKVGTVHEVKKDKLRMVWGKDKDGKDVLSPWLPTGNHRGGAREARFYKKGQNVVMFSPGGDLRQGIVMPYSPNKNFMRPDHANKSGQDEETYQIDDLRVKKTKEGYDIWLQPPNQKQNQQNSYLRKMPQQQDSGTVKSKVRLNKDGGITGRIGTKVRFSAHEKGAKIKAGGKYAIFCDDKGCWSTHEIKVKKDPIPDDDK